MPKALWLADHWAFTREPCAAIGRACNSHHPGGRLPPNRHPSYQFLTHLLECCPPCDYCCFTRHVAGQWAAKARGL